MLAWVTPAIWEGLSVLAFILQLAGVLGVITACVMAIMDISEIVMEVADNAENTAGSREEDTPVQPGL